MIQDLFHISSTLSRQQENWLRMVAAIPGAKQAFQDPVTPEDHAVAQEAKTLLDRFTVVSLAEDGTSILASQSFPNIEDAVEYGELYFFRWNVLEYGKTLPFDTILEIRKKLEKSHSN